jgi:hypothetical protein
MGEAPSRSLVIYFGLAWTGLWRNPGPCGERCSEAGPCSGSQRPANLPNGWRKRFALSHSVIGRQTAPDRQTERVFDGATCDNSNIPVARRCAVRGIFNPFEQCAKMGSLRYPLCHALALPRSLADLDSSHSQHRCSRRLRRSRSTIKSGKRTKIGVQAAIGRKPSWRKRDIALQSR